MADQRRSFLKKLALGSVAAVFGLPACDEAPAKVKPSKSLPLAISTWPFGLAANEAAWQLLSQGGSALDAVEQGVRVVEADEENQSVGIGGLPDRDGHVTLDACIMDPSGNCGSVAFLEHIKHPISVARRVMERTPHIMLVGDGALQFALYEGFEREDLLTAKSRIAWQEWLKTAKYEPVINAELHDTIGMLTMDKSNDLAGACTTSGMAYKMHGRVGDSPLIGAGMYVDNEIGGAAATGLGEAVIRIIGSFLVVEQMRRGKSPTEACREALGRLIARYPGYEKIQVGFIAVNKAGQTGAMSLKPGFSYALYQDGANRVLEAEHLL